jgi:hypothetical protein
MLKKMVSMLSTLLVTCLFFFGLGEYGLFQEEDCYFVSVITVNSALITRDNPGQEGFIIIGDLMKVFTECEIPL